jgi:hypothetical protein
MLYLTSFGIGAVAYSALLRREKLVGTLYLVQYGASVLHHANYTRTNYLAGEWVARLDRFLARCIGVVLICRALGMKRTARLWLTVLINLCVPVIYFVKLRPTDDSEHYQPYVICTASKWHAVMHLCTMVGGLLFIEEARSQK